MAFGLTSDGFNKKTLADIAGETETELRNELGSEIQLGDSDPLTNIKGVLDERESLIWDLVEAVYNNIGNIDSAEGVALDNIVALNGLTRLDATKGTATIIIAGTPGTVVPVGFQVAKVDDESVVLTLLSEVTIDGDGASDGEFEFITAGFFQAPAGTLTVIVNPVAGVDSVTNAEEAIPGRDLETDSALKIRRLEDLESADGCSDNGIRDALQNQVSGVTDAFVVSNRRMIEVDGRPPKSFEAFVLGGSDQEIANKILEVEPAGIESFGTEEVVVEDDEGNDHTIKFSRITAQEIEAQLIITPNTDDTEGPIYPADGDDLVKAALKEFIDALGAGGDIVNSATYTPINTVAGVIGITATYRLKGVGGFLATNISIARNLIPTIALADIAITHP